jgi:hypothetical protein
MPEFKRRELAMTSTTRWMMTAISCTVLSIAAAARVDAQQLTDVKGSKDPAAIKRYEGAVIIGYKFSKFDEFTFLAGPLTPSKASSGPNLVPSKVQRVEGSTRASSMSVPKDDRRSKSCATTSRNSRRPASRWSISARAPSAAAA